MTETWLLILLIQGGTVHNSYGTSLEFETRSVCVSNGERIAKELKIVRNPKSNWSKGIIRSATYSCNKVIR